MAEFIYKEKNRATYYIRDAWSILGWTAHELRTLRLILDRAFPVTVMTGQYRMTEYIYLPDGISVQAFTDGDADSRWTTTFPLSDDCSPFQPIVTRVPWRSIEFARSNDARQRHQGLKHLASLQNLHPSVCLMIGQASDHRMALSLALSANADLRMLLRPPPLPHDMSKSDVSLDLKQLLSHLRMYSSDNKCLEYFTSIALKETYFHSEECYADWWHSGSEATLPVRQSPPTREMTKMLCLQALLEHSNDSAYKRKFVDFRGLQVLMKLGRMSKVSSDEQIIIAQIIGNLALDKNIRDKIFQSGWVTVLAEWSRSSRLEVSLPAYRALMSLDDEDNDALHSGIYVAYPLHWDTKKKILCDVVFVHGLLGGAFKTWRQECREKYNKNSLTVCWPKDWLSRDCPHVRILLVDYETRLTEWSRSCPYDSETRTLESRSVELQQKLVSAGVGRRPVIWVSHSMGGLLVKNLLLQSQQSEDPHVQQLCDVTKGIVFYSVPHLGSSLASFHLGSHWVILPSPEVGQLGRGSTHLAKLHERFSTWIGKSGIACLSFGEQRKTALGHLGMTATFVSPESAEPGFGEFHSVDTDHIRVCKPTDPTDFVYVKLADFVNGLVDELDENVGDGDVRPDDGLRFILSASFS